MGILGALTSKSLTAGFKEVVDYIHPHNVTRTLLKSIPTGAAWGLLVVCVASVPIFVRISEMRRTQLVNEQYEELFGTSELPGEVAGKGEEPKKSK